MKLSTAFVIVLPSLVTLSFVTEDVLTAPFAEIKSELSRRLRKAR